MPNRTEKRMALPYVHHRVEAESFQKGAGLAVRPVKDQKFPTNLLIEGNKSLVADYPVGTRFKVQVALTDRPTGGGQFLFSSWQWDVKVLTETEPN